MACKAVLASQKVLVCATTLSSEVQGNELSWWANAGIVLSERARTCGMPGDASVKVSGNCCGSDR